MANQDGPEFAPLRKYVETFKLIVEIHDKADNIIRSEIMDYGKSDDRNWLGKLSFWAWTNGHKVVTRAENRN